MHEHFNYEEASIHLRKLLDEIAVIKQNRLKTFEYNGPEIQSSSILCADADIAQSFTKESLMYDKERGRDKIDVFIRKVFQLGYSVGHENARRR